MIPQTDAVGERALGHTCGSYLPCETLNGSRTNTWQTKTRANIALATPNNSRLTGESVHVDTLSRQAYAHVPEGEADGDLDVWVTGNGRTSRLYRYKEQRGVRFIIYTHQETFLVPRNIIYTQPDHSHTFSLISACLTSDVAGFQLSSFTHPSRPLLMIFTSK